MGVFITTAVGTPMSPNVQWLSPRLWWEVRQAWVPCGPTGQASLTTAFFPRCTLCTAGLGPASSKLKRNFPRASSAIGPSAALPHLLPEEPSKGISPDTFPCAPVIFPACLLSCTFGGCLKQCYGQHKPGEGLAVALPPSSATSFPFHPREGEGGRDRNFFYIREKGKKKVFSSLVVVW